MKRIILTILPAFLITLSLNAQIKLSGAEPTQQPCTALTGQLIKPGAIDTTKGRSVANNDMTWENGDVILVKFMDNIGSDLVRNRIMQYAKEWEQYANITLKFVPDNTPTTNIRILLGGYDDRQGHNSAVGISGNDIAQYQQTMNLDTSDFIDYKAYEAELKNGGPILQYLKNKGVNFNGYTFGDFYKDIRLYKSPSLKWNSRAMRGTTIHEFGHALGLLHEQSYPGGIKWNRDTVYKYYARTQKWDKATVDFNVLEASDFFYTNGTSYDPKSIMHYAVHSWQTLDGYSVSKNYDFSDGDKMIIAALYPKNQKVSSLAVPKIQITNITRGEVKNDDVRKGIVINPSFDLTTSAVLGKVYFVARLTTEDGKNYIPTTNERFKWNGMAATYLKMNLLPSSKVSYNKGIKKNLELFFPYKEMPELSGKTVKIHFAVYVDDEVNNRYKNLTFNFLSSPVSVPR